MEIIQSSLFNETSKNLPEIRTRLKSRRLNNNTIKNDIEDDYEKENENIEKNYVNNLLFDSFDEIYNSNNGLNSPVEVPIITEKNIFLSNFYAYHDDNMNAYHESNTSNEDIDDDFDDDIGWKKLDVNNDEISLIEKRRLRNKEHAKLSRDRKTVYIESVQKILITITEENNKIKSLLRLQYDIDNIVLQNKNNIKAIVTDLDVLSEPDFGLLKSLQDCKQNFVITDPLLFDNPVVFCNEGFLQLTGFNIEDLLGRNMRCLQGPQTDESTTFFIKQGIERGVGTTGVILNYTKQKVPFWIQFFITPITDTKGKIINYLGIQCKVTEQYVSNFRKMNSKNKINKLP